MTNSPRLLAKTLTFFLLTLLLALPFKARALDQTTANALAASMLSASGRHNAVISVPNCLSGELAIGFWNQAGDTHLIVDGFESDPVLLAAAQQSANALGLLGRNLYMRSDTLSLNAYSMPYADNFVDLVAVTNLGDADFANISYAEMERVLCTSGQARLGRAASEGAGLSTATLIAWTSGTHALSTAAVVNDATGTWVVITKISRLPNTYEGGGSVTNAGTRFYNDQVATWPTLPQWAGKPYGGIASNGTGKLFNWGCLAKICVGGGRMYGFDDNNPNALCALRAQNGHLLWTIPGLNMDSAGGIQPFSKGVVYENEIIDGETGVVTGTIPLPAWTSSVSYQVANDILYAVGRNSSGVNTLVAYDLVNRVTVYSNANFADNKAISSYNVGWMIGSLPSVVMAGGKLYTNSGTSVYCYNTSDGSKNWGPVIAPASINNMEASPNGVMIQSGYSGTVSLYFLAVADGSLQWGPKTDSSPQGFEDIAQISTLNGGKEAICTIGNGAAIDLLTGTSGGAVGWYGSGNCAPGASMTPAGFFARRDGISYSMALRAGPNSSDPYASDCTDSPFAASGLTIYKDKWVNCSCYGLFRGTTAQAPLGSFNPEQKAVQSERLQQGPAYGNVNVQVTPDGLDWATHRANINRSGYVPVPIVTNSCVQLWKYTNPTPNSFDRDLYDDFVTYQDVTPVVTAGAYSGTAGSYTYLAGSDGVVKCLSSITGSLVWSYATGAWVFSAPTVANGCVYVGSGDGYAYCLEAQTGRLVWRFRAAPAERRFNYYGHQISTWPILTGVLVHPNGNAYFASGMMDQYGVQVFAVNAQTGAIVWQNTTAGVCLDNRPGLARVGHMPGGYITAVGNQLMVKETTHAYSLTNQRIDVYDLNTGAISPQDTSFPHNSQNGYGYWSGRQIGVMGNYVIGWGEDIHTEMETEQYGGSATLSQMDASGNPVRPFLIWSGVTRMNSSVNALVWDNTEAYLDVYKFELSGSTGMTQYLNNAVANPPPTTADPTKKCTVAYNAALPPKTTDNRWKPQSVGGKNAGSALTTNCLVELSGSGDIGIMDRVTGNQYFHVNSGGTPYLQGMAVDRSGKIIVVNRSGDVVCYGTPGPVVVTPPTDVAGVDDGQPVTFSVEAAGQGVTYQWQCNGVNIAGATGATLNIPSVSDSNAGTYNVVVSNTNGSVTSNPAVLALSVATAITSPSNGAAFSQPGDGQNVPITLSATATSVHGTITKVEFYVSGTTKLGEVDSAPYNLAWSAAPGNYAITSMAYDSTGKTGVSQPVNITVARLALHYPLDETSGAVVHDSSGNGNNGTIINQGNAASWTTQGLFNGSLVLSPTNATYHSSGISAGPITTMTNSSFTVSYWVNNSKAPSYGLASFSTTGSCGIFTTPGIIWYTLSGSKCATNFTAPSTLGTWYNYTIVVTPAEIDWYINGTVYYRYVPPAGQTWKTSYQSFGFGNNLSNNGGMSGMMDEVKLYNCALNPTDIMALYTGNIPYALPQPTISLTSPIDGTIITATNSVPLAVTIGTCSHYPMSVNYYANGSLIGTSGSAPYGFTWNNVARGNYALTAVALDGLGQTGTSNVANVSFSYVTEPVINLAGGTYLNAQNVVVTCTDPTATIYYTTDGSTPTTSSSSVVSGSSILVNHTMILKVEAFKSGMYPSELQTFVYRIGGALSGGSYHSLMVDSVAPLWAWGTNWYGEIGDGTTTQRYLPVCISNSCSANMVSISAGSIHSLGVGSDGSVWAWGYNYQGQLGIGSTAEQNSPVKLSGVTNAISVAGGANHSLAVKADGTVWAWGYNYYGQLGDGTVTQRNSPVLTGSGVLTNIVAVAAGSMHSLALKSDGTVWAWGYNNDGELGNGTTTSGSTPVQVSGLSNVMAIAAGQFHSLAIKKDGTVWAWGQNSSGQLGDGTTTQRSTPVQATVITSAASISGGESHTLALKSDGTVWAWGGNSNNQLGDGTINNRSAPAQVSGLSNITSVAAGYYHSLALGNDGSLWAWGQNSYGQLGSGTTINLTVPTATISPSAPSVLFTVGSETCSQAAGPINITVQLTAVTAASVTVPFTFAGTAVKNTDYTISGTSVVIPAGQSSGMFVITPINGTAYRGSRTIILTMGTPTNATKGLTTVNTVTLTDVNPMPTLSFTTTSMSQAENSGTAYLVAQLSASSGLTTTMPFSCAGTAVAGTNYTITGSSITIAAGHLSGTISVKLINWTPYQGNQTLMVNMGVLTNASLGSITSETLTILDVNPMPITLTNLLSNQTVAWGQQATFGVVATGSTPAYQWSENGKAISGATNASYTTGSAGVSDNGDVFSVVVSNAVSSATSSATLTVLCNTPPTINITGPANGAVLSPAPLDLVIRVNVQSPAISSVEFFQGATSLGQTTGDFVTWSNVADGNYVLTAKVTDSEGQTATSAPVSITVSGSAPVSGTSYPLWVAAHNLAGISALETAQPACDGVANLVKYALGLDPCKVCSKPTDGTCVGLPWVSGSGTGMSMTYQMDTAKTDITYTVEASTDMVTWTTTGVTSQTLSTNGTVQTIQASVPMSGRKMFLHLRVTK